MSSTLNQFLLLVKRFSNRPDMTVAVEWALMIEYLSSSYAASSPIGGGQPSVCSPFRLHHHTLQTRRRLAGLWLQRFLVSVSVLLTHRWGSKKLPYFLFVCG